MPRTARRTVGKSFFALTLAARLHPSSSLVGLSPSISRAFPTPRLLCSSDVAASSTCLDATCAAAAGPVQARRKMRRARPAWKSHSSSESPPAYWSTAGRVSLGCSSDAHIDGGAAALASTQQPDERPSSRVAALTHDQLPEESIYLLDGTSMLFRAFYGRGAGG